MHVAVAAPERLLGAVVIDPLGVDVIDDCGHLPWLEQPGSINAALGRAGLP